jgi:glycosyltransferase 2 family protein
MDYNKLESIKNPWSIAGYAGLASVGFALIVFISSFAWKITLEFLYGKKIAFSEIRTVYAKSNIAKYIPAGNFAGRNVLGKKLGFSHIDMALSTIIEILTLLITACLWSLVFAYSSIILAAKAIIKEYSVWPFVALIAVAVVVVAVLIIFGVKKGLVQKYRKLFTLGFLRVFVVLFLIYTLTMIIPGVFLVVIFNSLGLTLTLHNIIVIIAAYMISWVAGYVVPVSGGIGVREVILLAVLEPVCGGTIALAAALVHRLASIIGDVLAFLFELIYVKITKKG